MRLTLTTESGDIKLVDVSSDISSEDLKALAEAELQIPANAITFVHNGRELASGSLQSAGVAQDDILLVMQRPSQRPVDQVEEIRQQILNEPATLARVSQQNPELASAVHNPEQFRRVLAEINRKQREAEEKRRQEELYLETADPFDLEAQKKIEEQIRKENISRNLEIAMENNPEAFGRVVMLYIDMEVNGVPVKAFVDSGAQATIMSPSCAEKCKIMHLLDERFHGTAEGVGTAKILGRVHSAQVKLGSQFLSCAFTIMEGKGVDLLFGLDQLKRYQACIDLERNCLRINGEDIRFLSEHELPEQAKEKSRPPPDASTSSGQSSSAKPPTSASPAVASGSVSRYSEDVIKGLTDLGVTRDVAIRALDASGGNPDIAANMLF